MSEEPVIQIDGLTKQYGQFTALNHLSLSLDRGHILGLIGPNGAGKTTTIRILVGLTKPTSGRAFIAGTDCFREAHRIKHLVGYMPDTFGSYDNMRVREYLDFFGAAFGIPRRRRMAQVQRVLELTSATWMQDRFVETLSHGMKQRVSVARTLLHDPEVLILDEPANGLDPQARIEMRELLLSLAAAGKTLIVTSHILPELSRICDQVAILLHGQLKAFGTLPQIFRQISQARSMEVQLVDASELESARALVEEFTAGEGDVSASEAEAAIRFRSAASEKQLSELLSALVERGIRIVQFRELQSDLEEAFLTVARGQNRPEETPSTEATVSQAGSSP